jgi:hypothetical protein
LAAIAPQPVVKGRAVAPVGTHLKAVA